MPSASISPSASGATGQCVAQPAPTALPIVLADFLAFSVGFVLDMDDGTIAYANCPRTFSARASCLWLLFLLLSDHSDQMAYLQAVGLRLDTAPEAEEDR